MSLSFTINLYQKALDKWGKDAQIRMVFEEIGEFQTELSRYERKDKFSMDKLAEEIADLEIMLDQLKYVIFKNNGLVELKKLTKLVRLKTKLEEKP